MLSSKFRAAQIRLRRRQIDAGLRAKIDSIEHYLGQPDGAEGAPVLFFNASTRISRLSQNAGFSLVASYALRAAGVPVRYLVCEQGLSQCMLGSDPNHLSADPPCAKCIKLSRDVFPAALTLPLKLAPHHESETPLELHNKSFESLRQWTYKGFSLGELCLPTLQWVMRSTILDQIAGIESLFIRYLSSAASLVDQMEIILDKQPPRAVVVFNGITYPEAVAREVAKKHGISAITHEVGLRPLSAFFSHDHATFRELEIPADFTLNDERNQRLDKYLENRFHGNFSMAGVEFWPDMKALPVELTDRFDHFKQAVALFSNVIFDTSQVHANQIFLDMFDWLDTLAKFIRRNPDTLFILRAHPDEDRPGKQSRQSVEQWVSNSSLRDLNNFVFISPSDYVNSYEIMTRSNFVLVYNSSIGLEASLLGRPVLAAGRARYSLMTTVETANTREDYGNKLANWLKQSKVTQNPEHRINARRFLYYELFNSSLNFSQYLSADPTLAGFVTLSDFEPSYLHKDPGGELKILQEGILSGTPFSYSWVSEGSTQNAC